MQNEARVVIVGGGIAGASIAYHLAEHGWNDIVVIEKGELVSGTTSHAPGLVGQLRTSVSLMKMLMYSVSLYRTLEVDGEFGFFEVGGVRLASSKERLQEITRQAAFAREHGLEAHLISPAEAKELFPLMSLDKVEGALYIPSDGSATAPILARALINRATAKGVHFHANTQVLSFDLEQGRIGAINTNNGSIKTDTVVIASGIWSSVVGPLAGISVPLTPMQHQYAATGAMAELTGKTLPNLRDPDKLVYLRQRDNCFVIGGYERNPKVFKSKNIPERANPTVQDFDAPHFQPLVNACAERVPLLNSASWVQQVNGLESFTPDGEFLLGPSRDIQGLWIACGFCAHGISGSGGVGKVMAEWIVNGEPGIDLTAMDVNRFGKRASDLSFIEEGACSIYSTYYDLAPSHAGKH